MIKLIPLKFNNIIPQNFGLVRLARVISNHLTDGDIIAVSSKLISFCENRLVKLSDVKPSKKALELAKKCKMPAELCELVIKEADKILGCNSGFLLTMKFGMLCPNAGVDLSNAPEGFAVLYPKDPKKSADELRRLIEERIDGKVGVVLTDSRLLPLRRGVCGVALACSGFNALKDERGRRDLFGKPLKNTVRNLADMIASASQLLMGEANEKVPIVIVRGLNVEFGDYNCDLAVEPEICIYKPLLFQL